VGTIDTAGWTVGVRPERAGDEAAVGRVRGEVLRSIAGLRGAEAHPGRSGHVHDGEAAGRVHDGEAAGHVHDDEVRLSLVGTIGPVVVGALRAVVDVDPDGVRTCTITFLGVEPAARGVGVGRALLTSAREWATTQGASALDSSALPGDRSTKNFFEAHGMVARLIIVRTPLA
jgi:GNAT superfamily N-acetyltransferase